MFSLVRLVVASVLAVGVYADGLNTAWGPSNSRLRQEMSAAVVPPSQDPFYTPGPGFAAVSKNGDILKSRQITPALMGSDKTFQFLVRSTDSQNNASAFVTTLLVPKNANKTQLFSVQVPYDSSYINCSPSYTLQSTSGNATSDQFITNGLQEGYYVNVPDYEGPLAAFTNGVQSGQATLDSLRACLRSEKISGLKPTALYAIGGYSGGALASEWATELQPTYAPELKIAGAALGGLTPNVTSVLLTVNGGPFVGLAPAGIIGLSIQEPAYYQYLQTELKPATKAKFNQAGMQCLEQDVTDYAFNNIFDYFIGGEATLLSANATVVTNMFGIMGMRSTPTTPIYAYKGVLDEISPVADTDALISKYCSHGATIQYIRDLTADHLLEEEVGEPGAFAYIKQRLAGVPAPKGCKTTTGVLDKRS